MRGSKIRAALVGEERDERGSWKEKE
jgi:hypothetical protein